MAFYYTLLRWRHDNENFSHTVAFYDESLPHWHNTNVEAYISANMTFFALEMRNCIFGGRRVLFALSAACNYERQYKEPVSLAIWLQTRKMSSLFIIMFSQFECSMSFETFTNFQSAYICILRLITMYCVTTCVREFGMAHGLWTLYFYVSSICCVSWNHSTNDENILQSRSYHWRTCEITQILYTN